MIFKNYKFIKSATNISQLEGLTLPEIAIVGRSNVGKSSLINMLANNKKLAKTSSTPGRTRLINLFNVDDKFCLVDLPGYGFARATTAEQNDWAKMINAYLETDRVKACLMLLDIRHNPSEKDLMMLDWLSSFNVPVIFVLTKADKIKNSERAKLKQAIATDLKVGVADLIVTSGQTSEGRDAVCNKINQVLGGAL